MNAAEKDLLANMAKIAKNGVTGVVWTDYMWGGQAWIASGLTTTYEPGGWLKMDAPAKGALSFGKLMAYTPPSLTIAGEISVYGAKPFGSKNQKFTLRLAQSLTEDALDFIVDGQLHTPRAVLVSGSFVNYGYVVETGSANVVIQVQWSM